MNPGGGTNVPIVRYFIPCDDARRWQGGGEYVLTRVRHQLRAPAGGGHVRTRPELWFYLLITDATGPHTFRIQQVCLQDQTLIYPWPPFTLDMGPSPAVVHEHAIPLRRVLFWKPGQYEFVLSTAGRPLAAAEIDVR